MPSSKGTWGGPGRGQGMKPLYEEGTMSKYQFRLAPEFHDFLGNGEAAPRLRALLEWCSENPSLVVEDPGEPNETKRTSYPLTQKHAQIAESLGEGNRTGGVRRAIKTAIDLNLDLDSLKA
ncbi:MAG: hypothetical protein KC441_05350 [Anaerolineales bacterium]|nr:hypothetical protein [Anaerolineales bacterium]